MMRWPAARADRIACRTSSSAVRFCNPSSRAREETLRGCSDSNRTMSWRTVTASFYVRAFVPSRNRLHVARFAAIVSGVARAQRMVIEGLVQGVGFRWFTQRSATRLGIRGFVRNRADGAVEIEAEGDDDALSAFEADVRQGPAGARVDRVEITPLSSKHNPVFRIR